MAIWEHGGLGEVDTDGMNRKNNARDILTGVHSGVREKSGAKELPGIHKDDLSQIF